MATIDTIKEILQENLDIDPASVDESSTFDSLEIDSLDMVQLVCDLEERLGLKVIAVRVGAIDFLRDMAVLRVYYEGNDSGDVKNMLKIKNSEYASV